MTSNESLVATRHWGKGKLVICSGKDMFTVGLHKAQHKRDQSEIPQAQSTTSVYTLKSSDRLYQAHRSLDVLC